ncbi:hypothetical protein AX16_002969 [Volvariella volvacea WC 439]|nr:hypothetical protein AX16_002969 [Volvariella volvacea WC 439]
MASPVLPANHAPVTMETYREKATRKFKENPWVPLGSLATVGALVTAMVKMRRGQSKSFNNWLRVRVAAQGLTVVAIVAGTYNLGARREEGSLKTMSEADTERAAQEKAERERLAFEDRLKEAEITHELETALKNGRLQPPSNSVSSAGGFSESQSSSSPPPTAEPTASSGGSESKGGWFSRWK